MRPLVFARYVRPAERRPQLWRLALGLVLALGVYVGVIAAIFGAAYLLTGGDADPGVWAARAIRADRPGGTLLLLATFAGMALGPMLIVRLLHARRAGTLFGPAARTVRHFAIAAGIVLVFLGLPLVPWSLAWDLRPSLDPVRWAALLPLTLLGLVVQTGAEEVFFRGYLTQQLAARFRSRLAWMAFPALAFGLVHYDPTSAGANAWAVVFGATVFGLLAADLTAVTGSLGAAWGFHFANNVIAVALVATGDTITGLALYVTPYDLDEVSPALIFGDALLLAFAWIVCRRVLAR